MRHPNTKLTLKTQQVYYRLTIPHRKVQKGAIHNNNTILEIDLMKNVWDAYKKG